MQCEIRSRKSEMLPMNRIQGNQVSGLEQNEMDFMSELITNYEDDETIFNQFTGFPNDFDIGESITELSEDQLQLITSIENEAKSIHTENQTKHYMNMLNNFLKSQNLPTSFETMPERYIQSYLRLFFANIKKKNGEHYSTTSLTCMRAAFHRYFLETRDMPLIDNPGFKLLDKTYKAAMAQALKNIPKSLSDGGEGYQPIENNDMTLLKNYFDRTTPQKLQDEIFFNIIYYNGFRGREWIRSLTKSSIQIKENENGGVRYVDLIKPVHEKNVRVGNENSIRQTLMAETPESPSSCPVIAMELYINKLPSETLFPKAKANFSLSQWYCTNSSLGKNTLQDMMKNICKRANLEREYTNHCVRPTVVTSLRRQGFTEEQCMRVTGQKSKETLRRYDKRRLSEKVTFEEKRIISNALSKSFTTESGSNPISITSSSENMVRAERMIVEEMSGTSGSTVVLSAPSEKKMKIVANGDANTVTIVFE